MPLSFSPSTPHPRNTRSFGDDDPGNDDNENPFDDDNNDDYKDTNNSTQEDWAVQVFDTDPKKLHTFLVQCELNFQDHPSTFKKDHAKVVFAQSYLKGMALKWFELDLLSSGNPRSHPLWMDDWTEFVIKLQSTFGPHNPVANAENQLNHLQMKENKCINKYMVKFNQLASQVRGYGNGALCHQFYSGLPNHIKDEIFHVGKPHNLDDLHYLAQEINTCYWEHKKEVQHANKSSSTSNFPTNKPGSSTPNSSKGKPTTSSNTSSSVGNANSSSPVKSGILGCWGT
ncbi:hypothetical protein ID866_11469 [Astraeus odoratus]|nr:hypothetical protein ID866_11469 [Astraeus odoratus]